MTQEERNWKAYEASKEDTNKMRQTMDEVNSISSKWLLTLTAGSFGLSFAFIEKLVPLESAVSKPLLIAAWVCFAIALVLEVITYDISDIRIFFNIDRENRDLIKRYQGNETEYKCPTPFIDVNRVFGYIVVLAFIGGISCLLLFVAKNIL